jgi:hypothetical protein
VSLNYVTVTGTFEDGSGTPIPLTGQTAYCLFTPSTQVFASGIPLITPANPIQAPIIGGSLKGEAGASCLLLATDNTGLTFGGLTGFFFWTVQVFINGQAQPAWSFFLPHTPSPVDLSALANTAGGGGGASLPLTTLGDTLYENATPAPARLPGNTSATKNFLTQTGTGSVSGAPAWGTITAGDVPAATTSVQGAVILDGTASDIQPAGVAAAGAKGQAADAMHVHPYQPWQFNVKATAYGAVGNGKVITDATIAGGSLSTLTSATASFTNADTGKVIVVSQAGNTGNNYTPLFATITYVNSTTVTLSVAAAGAVTNVGAVYGTDDTAAIQSAVNAAVTYAQGNISQFAEVIFPPAYYMVAGSPVKGATQGNSQITLPIVTASTGTKVNLKLSGLADVTAPPEHWLQVTHNAPGSVLVCANGAGTYDATYGPSAMIGGPVNGYGGGGGTYSNMQLTVEGLTCLMPWTSTIGGMNLFGIGQAWIKSFSIMPMAVVPGSGSAWPQMTALGPTSNQYTSGLITPVVGNNDVNDIDRYTCYGMHIALAGSDHLNIKVLRTLFCNIGLLPTGAGGGPAHSAAILSWSCEAVVNPILVNPSGAAWGGYNLTNYFPLNVVSMDLESFGAYIIEGDSGSLLLGVVWFEDLQANSVGSPQPWYGANLNHYKTISLKSLECIPGPVASPQAAPSSGSAWNNYYYRDAWITLSATTITALSIDSTAQKGLAGSPAAYAFFLPAGHSYTPTYTGTLTHTVTLI